MNDLAVIAKTQIETIEQRRLLQSNENKLNAINIYLRYKSIVIHTLNV